MGEQLRLLLVEDSPEDAAILLWELKRVGFDPDCRRVETAAELAKALAGGSWDLVISDYYLPRFSGLDALSCVRSTHGDLPFIICSGKIGEDAAVGALLAGANDYLFKDNLTRLRQAILSALAAAEERQQRRDMERELTLLKQAIDAIPLGVTIVDNGGTIIYTNQAEADMHGYTVAELLQLTPRQLAPKRLWNGTAGCFNNVGTAIRESINLRKDGSEFPVKLISLPIVDATDALLGIVTVSEDISEWKAVEEKLLFMSSHDALTGLFNRAYFEEEVTRLDHSRQFPVSVIMIDVNGLKVINDRQGHQHGDQLLREVGRILPEMFRTEDMVARIGGDEFIVLLPATERRTADGAIVRIREYLQTRRRRERQPHISLAFGAATATAPGTLRECIKLADQNMYADKLATAAERRRG